MTYEMRVYIDHEVVETYTGPSPINVAVGAIRRATRILTNSDRVGASENRCSRVYVEIQRIVPAPSSDDIPY